MWQMPTSWMEAGMKGAKKGAKAINAYAGRGQSTYLGDRLEEELNRMDSEEQDRRSRDRGYAGRAVKRLRNAALTKTGLQLDSLGKQTSPAMAGGSVDAPMPQTEYAKGTLNNEYYNRLNKKQLAEMMRLQQQQGSNNSNQSSSTSTTSDGTTTTTTTSGLSNSGLMAALSIGSVM